jgi:triosephosphate isomerase
MNKPVFVINLKNYPEVLGDAALRLASSAERVSSKIEVDIFVAPPIPSLASVAKGVKIPVLSQKVDDSAEGKSTGAVIPEALKAWGCAGSIINHAEARLPLETIGRLVPRMKRLQLSSCVCAEDTAELERVAKFSPEHIAVEPPELIGTGVSVSTARPELVSGSVEAAKRAGYRGMVLCGAGIVDAADARRAIELGTRGILVASSVVKSSDWDAKILELASALV